MKKIVGLGEKLTAIKGQPFTKVVQDGESDKPRLMTPTFGDFLFELALDEKKGESDTGKKKRKFKLAQKIANAATEVELDDAEIELLKEAAGYEGRNLQFTYRIEEVLDAGGIQKASEQ